MESIKKISLVALAAILSLSFASAQKVGFQAGYSSESQTLSGSLLGITASTTATLNGFHVGPIAELNIQGPVTLQYGLLYNFLTHTDNSDNRTIAHALDLPVRIVATFPVGNGLSAFVFGGPNFNFGLSQRTEDGENLYSYKYNDRRIISPFNLQFGIGGGLRYNAFAFRLGYDWGMTNRSSIDNTSFKTNDLKAGIAYYF